MVPRRKFTRHKYVHAPAGSHLNRDPDRASVPRGLFEVLADAFVPVFWFVDRDAAPVRRIAIAVLLAFVPYALLRGPIGRLARHWIMRSASS